MRRGAFRLCGSCGGCSAIKGIQVALNKRFERLPVLHGSGLIATAEDVCRTPLLAGNRIATLFIHIGKLFTGRLIYPIGVGNEFIDCEAILPEQPCSQPGTIVPGNLVMLRRLIHDDFDAQARHVAAISHRAISRVP